MGRTGVVFSFPCAPFWRPFTLLDLTYDSACFATLFAFFNFSFFILYATHARCVIADDSDDDCDDDDDFMTDGGMTLYAVVAVAVAAVVCFELVSCFTLLFAPFSIPHAPLDVCSTFFMSLVPASYGFLRIDIDHSHIRMKHCMHDVHYR